MGRKKKNKKEDSESFLNAFKKETLEGITAIFFIIISLFLVLSPFGKAGIVGTAVHNFLELIFGPIGYYLLPIILLILGASFIKSLSHNLAWPKIIGASLMLMTGLGLIDIVIKEGGMIGHYINVPLLSLFGTWMTVIGHIGVLIISILVIFDLSLKFSHIQDFMSKYFSRDKKESDEEVEPEIKQPEDESTEEAEESDEEEDEEIEVVRKDKKEEEPKKTNGLIFFSRKNESFKEYTAPPLSLLSKDSGKPGVGDIKANTNIIKRTLANFGIQVEMDEVSVGPSVTRYALKPAQGVKLSKIVSLQNDLALALAAHPLRIEAPIPGKSLVGIEIPNSSKTTVGLASIFKNTEFQKSDKPLLLGLGRGISGDSLFTNLAKAPHMLIAGATGAGKSVTIHAIITSLLYRNSPEMLKFIMIDPKRVELTMYNKIPHLLTPVITDPKKTILSLKWAGKEMSRRYDILEEHGVRDITSYHENILEPALKKGGDPEDMPEKMPYIVVIIDELADIMQTYPRELESGIVRLAQMSRAVGIHLIISTQRPSVNVITGLIKANIPSRIALQVASQIDSRTILDMPGAEKLLGAGDMLFLSGDISQPRRIQSAFISENEVKSVVSYLYKNYEFDGLSDAIDLDAKAEESNSESLFNAIEDDGEDEDDLYSEAKAVVIHAGKASTSYLQRKLKIGYSRAARIMDILEENGVIGPADGSKPREILTGGDDGDGADSGNSYDEASSDSDEDNSEEENEQI
ncbi:DNA translocase FtsK [Candidatus Parcubacteria bacterium]|nr:DNA translocase FtsK [Candidatus Parcubacteria bacterium]